MQEDVDNKSITLVINTGKMTGRLLKQAVAKYLNHRKQKSRDSPDVQPQGKQSVKKLVGEGQGINNIEITDGNIKSFERVARKYGVTYALKKDITGEKPRYLVFFRAKEADALTAAFKEYSGKTLKREKKPSLLAQLRRMKELMPTAPKQEKKKELER